MHPTSRRRWMAPTGCRSPYGRPETRHSSKIQQSGIHARYYVPIEQPLPHLRPHASRGRSSSAAAHAANAVLSYVRSTLDGVRSCVDRLRLRLSVGVPSDLRFEKLWWCCVERSDWLWLSSKPTQQNTTNTLAALEGRKRAGASIEASGSRFARPSGLPSGSRCSGSRCLRSRDQAKKQTPPPTTPKSTSDWGANRQARSARLWINRRVDADPSF